MGIMDLFKQKPKWEMEKQRRTEFERQMARSGYELAEVKRQESLLQRKAEIARFRMNIEEMRPRPSPLASLRDVLRRRSISEMEERGSRNLERQLITARRQAKIAKSREYVRKFVPKPTQSAGPPSYGGITDALNFNPFKPPKKGQNARGGG